MMISLSRFLSPLDRAPWRWTTTWSDFAVDLSEPRISPCSRASCTRSSCPHKRGPCWAPVLYLGEERRPQRVEAITMFVFDLDQVTDDQFDELRLRLGDLRYLAHSTHSDQPNSRCLRIIFPLSRPVALDEWVPLWRQAHSSLVPIADSICRDAARIYFFPSCPRDAGFFIQVNEGRLLDVDALLPITSTLQPGES